MPLGNSPMRRTDLFLERSKSFALTLRFVEQDGSELDMEDSVLRLVVVDPAAVGGEEAINMYASWHGGGEFQFPLQAAQLGLLPGEYPYDVTLVTPDGYSVPVLKGSAVIGENADLDGSNEYSSIDTLHEVQVRLDGRGGHVTVCVDQAPARPGPEGPQGLPGGVYAQDEQPAPGDPMFRLWVDTDEEAPWPDHSEIPGRDASDQHPIASITGLQDSLDGKLGTDHLTAPDPHGQYLKPADADGRYSPADHTHPSSELPSDLARLSDVDAAIDDHETSPSAHRISGVEGLQNVLDSKAPKVHTHGYGDLPPDIATDQDVSNAIGAHRLQSGAHPMSGVEGLQSALATKAPASHKHVISDLPAGLSPILDGNGPPDYALGELGDYYVDTTNQVLYGPKKMVVADAQIETVPINTELQSRHPGGYNYAVAFSTPKAGISFTGWKVYTNPVETFLDGWFLGLYEDGRDAPITSRIVGVAAGATETFDSVELVPLTTGKSYYVSIQPPTGGHAMVAGLTGDVTSAPTGMVVVRGGWGGFGPPDGTFPDGSWSGAAAVRPVVGVVGLVPGWLAAVEGGVPEAPIDGKQYARQDGDWSEVAPPGMSQTEADPAGTAAAGDAAHAAAANPHPQYLTQAEGDGLYSPTAHSHDSRYYTESETNTLLAGKAPSVHTHTVADTTGLQSALDSKAPTVHTHDDRYYTETETNSLLAGKASASHTHDGVYDPAGTAASAVTAHEAKANPHPQYAADAHTHTKSQITDLGTVVPEAPADGKQYARQDGDWSEVAPPGMSQTEADARYVNTTGDTMSGDLTFEDSQGLAWSDTVRLDYSSASGGNLRVSTTSFGIEDPYDFETLLSFDSGGLTIQVPTGSPALNALSRRIINVADPTSNKDAVPKAYVDSKDAATRAYVDSSVKTPPRFRANFANVTVPNGTATRTASAPTMYTADRISVSNGVFTLDEDGIYVASASGYLTAGTTRAFVEWVVGGSVYYRQPIGSGENGFGATALFTSYAGGTCQFQGYQATGSSQTMTSIRIYIVKVSDL